MKQGNILIVDDNIDLLQGMSLFLRRHFEKVETMANPESLLETIQKSCFDLILLDMNFKAAFNTGNEGLFWLRKILDQNPDQTVLVMTAYGDIELAVNSMKAGAIDFIQKDWDEDKIYSSIQSAFKLQQSKKEIKQLKEKQSHLMQNMASNDQFYRFPSKAMESVYTTIGKIAGTDASVLILGENGTGKEIIAKAIHQESKRQNEIFVSVDLGSITETLFESELFGHVKGAFTDARADKPGRIEIASHGTLFLDEIGNLTVETQAKLLSVLQNKTVCRVGSLKSQTVDFRLICATNMDLEQSIINKLFRDDLFYRINTITLHIPPLRERPEDIPGLARFFLLDFNQKYQKEVQLQTNVIKLLQAHPWPGNIRELKHCIEKGVILSDSKQLNPDDLFSKNKNQNSQIATKSLDLSENEKRLILMALKQCEGNLSLSAKKLGINRSTLYEKIKKYSIDAF